MAEFVLATELILMLELNLATEIIVAMELIEDNKPNRVQGTNSGHFDEW